MLLIAALGQSRGGVEYRAYSVNYKILMSDGRLNAERKLVLGFVLRVKASPVVHARRRLDHLALALRTLFYSCYSSLLAASSVSFSAPHPIFWRKKMNSHIIIFLINIVAHCVRRR